MYRRFPAYKDPWEKASARRAEGEGEGEAEVEGEGEGEILQLTNGRRNRFGSIRFGSGLFRKFIGSVRFSSVRFGSDNVFPGSTRFGLRFSDVSWLGPVLFSSFPCAVPAGSRIKRFGSVRFGQFGLVFYSFLEWQQVQSGVSRCPLRRSGFSQTPVLRSFRSSCCISTYN